MQVERIEPIQKISSVTLLYPPSFIDRFIRFIERLSLPYWLIYLLFFILHSFINHILAWIDGWMPPWTFSSILLTFPLWLWVPLSIVTFLNTIAQATLETFRPLLEMDDETFKRIKHEFTTMPARGVIINTVFWITLFLIVHFLAGEVYVQYGFGDFMQRLILVEGLFTYGIGAVLYYHSLRQLWLINHTVQTVKQFNLFNLDPVYAFSRLTAWTGISWVLMAGLTLLVFPMEITPGLMLGFMVLQVVLALAAFVLPLRFVNYRLVQEKRRLLAEHQRRVESTLARLHQSIDQHELSEVGQLNTAITGLNTERTMLEKIPTWPWRTDTLTGFLSATILPIILFLVQNAIRKWLGG